MGSDVKAALDTVDGGHEGARQDSMERTIYRNKIGL